MGSSQCFYTPLHRNYSFRRRSKVSRAKGSHGLHSSFLAVLSGLSKQGPVFRNSYVAGHLCHEIATCPRGSVLGVHRRHAMCLGKQKRRDKPWQSNGFSPPAPPQEGGRVGVAQPPPSGIRAPRPKARAPCAFLSHSNGRSDICREWRCCWCSSAPPQTTTTASWRLALPWVSPGVGWWVIGATGRANCAC
jgi:hypothetical protein